MFLVYVLKPMQLAVKMYSPLFMSVSRKIPVLSVTVPFTIAESQVYKVTVAY